MTTPTAPIAPVEPLEARISVTPDVVDVWGADSFPASDPPSNW